MTDTKPLAVARMKSKPSGARSGPSHQDGLQTSLRLTTGPGTGITAEAERLCRCGQPVASPNRLHSDCRKAGANQRRNATRRAIRAKRPCDQCQERTGLILWPGVGCFCGHDCLRDYIREAIHRQAPEVRHLREVMRRNGAL